MMKKTSILMAITLISIVFSANASARCVPIGAGGGGGELCCTQGADGVITCTEK